MRSVTMSDIARQAGVSKNTVSLALRHDPQIPAITRKKIEQIARKLGYAKDPIVAHLMARMRMRRPTSFKASLGLLNANQNRNAFSSHPTIPTYVAGCRRRAAELGYALDEFWLHDPELDGRTLNRILHARGIRGLIVVGLMKENRLPERFAATWQAHAAVVTGVRTREPTLSFCCVDHYILALRAFEHALRLGYSRPALVLDPQIDDLVEGRFTAAMTHAQRKLPTAQRIPGFYDLESTKADRTRFAAWLKRYQPDAILALYHDVKKWMGELGYRVPQDIGLIQLEWRADHPEWAGMNQHNDLTGEAAVDLVINMLHTDSYGVPDFPRAIMMGSSWVEGSTVKSAPAPALPQAEPTERTRAKAPRRESL
ncbi:MAG TPA: LacI family DNA-binding transcriptional regulator [Opitutaceae bacterium]|nr:LacI family DNA-binding transcriptional regulator [Opitutaceae bacterium]